MKSDLDNQMMRRALHLAEKGLYTTDPNPRVGCVIARDEKIIAEGYTSPVGGPHAEVNALLNAADSLQGATAYVTLEPCSHQGRTPPCVDALVAAGIKRVVYAVGDPNPLVNGNGHARLVAAGIEVTRDVLAAQAMELNIGFFHRMTHGRPWVTVKLGTSLDGKVALANGVSQWITGDASRLDVQRQRARSSAIMTGVGTILADDPRLTVRAVGIEMLGRHPLRVVCDSKLRTPTRARLFTEPGNVLIATTDGGANVESLLRAGAEIVEVAADAHNAVDLAVVLQLLAARGCNELLVEAGPTLSGRLVEQRLVDELLIYMAPTVLGSDARSMLQLPAIASMSERWNFIFHECQQIGGDLRLRLRLS
ncbi:MAG: bifunctional diaminohydroxyphosphoribosylaminopyrimidine deaminase/5-amino-6-(5-phosphoribosylamino)uracil reductase RibD [Candidatus Obscuribacterales bacterium]|nr:bifunctional diaminohydroxyphosphoribosylaminopyrimidine deaminase/5-amino-6-(5-phosphoribosylamino)uracil reductase RibD [Steroidobacteraceae bacterium]